MIIAEGRGLAGLIGLFATIHMSRCATSSGLRWYFHIFPVGLRRGWSEGTKMIGNRGFKLILSLECALKCARNPNPHIRHKPMNNNLAKDGQNCPTKREDRHTSTGSYSPRGRSRHLLAPPSKIRTRGGVQKSMGLVA